MTRFQPGEVYAFNYLWSHQHAAGEESGRKPRPACIVFRSLRSPSELYLFPITTRAPEAGRRGMEIPSTERRRCGLDRRSWLMLDEYNITLESRVYDFETLEPLGSFSGHFLGMVAREIRAVIVAGLTQPVQRS